MSVASLRIVGIAALVWSSALAASAQEAAATTTAAPAAFSQAQLEQMVAPIALYPDSLVAQILMASTYPLEIVQAARWLEQNPKLEGDALLEALKDQDWDTNVKALCGFRTVIARMNENLDWTRDLGDAVLSQRAELMDAVQRMRNNAYDAGNLKTTEQQVVTRQPDKIIVIQSANPQVVYVPTYSPTVVYAGWSYPYWYYPPLYPAYPYGYGFLAFGAGVAWGAWLSGGCGWGWGHSDIDIDIDRNANFDRNVNRDRDRVSHRDGAGDRGRTGDRARAGDRAGGKGKFQHNPSHRGGVNYRDSKTAQQFGAREGSNRVTRDQARGFDRGTGQRGGARATTRPAGPSGGRERAATTRGAGSGGLGSQRAATSGQRASRASGGSPRSTAYSGARNSGFDRASSSRGNMSRGGGGFSRGGGMSRGGGGGRGGGGRRR